MNSGDGRRSSGAFLIATAIIAAVIVYGSLYPFEFHKAAGIAAAKHLVRSWAEVPRWGDFLANILLYAPFGFFGALAIAGKARLLPGTLLVLITGTLLSTSMEFTQYYVFGRVSAANDVYANAIGTMLGAIVGHVVHRDFRWPLAQEITANPAPCLLLSTWLGYRLFPYVPAIDLHKYWNALKPVVLYPTLAPRDLFRYVAIWLTIGVLIEGVGDASRARLLYPLFIGVVLAARVAIVDKALTVAEVAAAGLAFGVWFLLTVGTSARFRVSVVALLLCASILVERLTPFRFAALGRDFGWVPFFSFIHGSVEVNIMSFFEKAFLYGSLIWLLGKAGLRNAASAILVATVLFATSWAQIYLPNRSAEITDAVMALLIGAIIALLETDTRGNRPSIATRPQRRSVSQRL